MYVFWVTMSNHQKTTVDAVRAALLQARMATYEVAAGVQAADDPAALMLYAWNAEVSGALLPPLHVCEVVIRNAVADALEALYGPRWPWSLTFELSLPDPKQGYSPRRDLQTARHAVHTTGKVIPELKFVFWQKMFTGRYDNRIWDHHLLRVMPNLDPSHPKSSGKKPLILKNMVNTLQILREALTGMTIGKSKEEDVKVVIL